jgi:ribosomal protein S1
MCQVLSFSDLGVTVGLEGGFQGLIYAEELDFQREGEGLRVGDTVSLFVQKVRRTQ